MVTVKVPTSNGHDWSDEYDYYDINEVHTTVIKKDGTKIVEPAKTERGEYRAHTWYKSQTAANWIKTENEME